MGQRTDIFGTRRGGDRCSPAQTAFRRRIPFAGDLGIEFVSAEAGRSQLTIEVAKRHLNGAEAVHGGVIMTLLDVAMALAGRSVEPAASSMVTIEMKTSFMQAAAPQSRLTAAGLCVHCGRTTAFCEAEVRDQRNRLLARASGTFKIVRPRPDGS